MLVYQVPDAPPFKNELRVRNLGKERSVDPLSDLPQEIAWVFEVFEQLSIHDEVRGMWASEREDLGMDRYAFCWPPDNCCRIEPGAGCDASVSQLDQEFAVAATDLKHVLLAKPELVDQQSGE